MEFVLGLMKDMAQGLVGLITAGYFGVKAVNGYKKHKQEVLALPENCEENEEKK